MKAPGPRSRAMPLWRILADDLTGALDSAAAFCGPAHVPVFLKTPPPGLNASPASPVQAVVTGSRNVPAAELPGLLQDSLPWFTQDDGGPALSFKKIDSLLRGNTFAEIAWLARTGSFDAVIFAPALPAQGRFTRGGQHWVGPPHQPDMPQAGQTIDLLNTFASVGQTARVVANLDGDLSAVSGVVIPDVVDDAGLARLAALSSARPGVAQRWLWCGSAGLAWALARHWKLAPAGPEAMTPVKGRVCIVTASRHPVLREQLQSLAPVCETMPLLPGQAFLPPAGPDDRPLLLDLATGQTLPTEQAQAQLMQQTHSLLHTLPRPATLVVIGGDTLLALCQASETHSLAASASPRPGWGRARFNGGLWDGITCYSRSGAFGAPDDLSALLETLTKKEHPT